MEARQEKLLRQIIKTYVATAEPVGSLFLAQKSNKKLSSATIRNEMGDLEAGGYIYQPHTSAGRVPTEKGYKFYVEKFLKKDGRIDRVLSAKISCFIRDLKGEEKIKAAARAAAELTEEAVIVAFNADRFYFTGLSYLFGKPEFTNQACVTTVSQVLDHCEEVLPGILELLGEEGSVLIGSDNPLGKLCSFLASPLQLRPTAGKGLFGILGPLRMDYERNQTALKTIMSII
ncbi:MAG: hypothetical protein HY982_01425 [Candidatus Magasanikbacteria bacterium]|nr:hypothetical protein [Candidatus Magasanikbacteria bacterium]